MNEDFISGIYNFSVTNIDNFILFFLHSIMEFSALNLF